MAKLVRLHEIWLCGWQAGVIGRSVSPLGSPSLITRLTLHWTAVDKDWPGSQGEVGGGRRVNFIFVQSIQKIESGTRHALIKIAKWDSSSLQNTFWCNLFQYLAWKWPWAKLSCHWDWVNHCELPWIFYKLKQVFVWGVKINTGGRFLEGGVRLHIHSRMQHSTHRFPLTPETWPWRQDYEGKTHSFSSPFSWLPPLGAMTFTECFFYLCFTPEEDDPPPQTFEKQPLHSWIRTSDEQLHNSARWRELFVWGVLQ